MIGQYDRPTDTWVWRNAAGDELHRKTFGHPGIGWTLVGLRDERAEPLADDTRAIEEAVSIIHQHDVERARAICRAEPPAGRRDPTEFELARKELTVRLQEAEKHHRLDDGYLYLNVPAWALHAVVAALRESSRPEPEAADTACPRAPGGAGHASNTFDGTCIWCGRPPSKWSAPSSSRPAVAPARQNEP
jgi:hypothetical protein